MQPGTSGLSRKQVNTADISVPIEGYSPPPPAMAASIAAGLPDVYTSAALANCGWHVFVGSVTQSLASFSGDALYAVHALAQVLSASRHVCAATFTASSTVGHTDGRDNAA